MCIPAPDAHLNDKFQITTLAVVVTQNLRRVAIRVLVPRWARAHAGA